MALTDYLTTSNLQKVSEGFNRYVVTPALDFGIAGFVFDVEGETVQEYSNEITDHYIEDNSVVQDHIASRPLKVTLKGYVGELTFKEESVGNILQDVGERLVTLDSYLPELTAQATQTYRVLENASEFNLEQDLDGISDLYSTIRNLDPTASKQQRAYLYFKSLKEQRVLMSIQTPFEFLEDMAIESIFARQGEATNTIAEFQVTFKQIRTASLSFVAFDPDKYGSTGLAQNQPQENKGKKQGQNSSLAYDLLLSDQGAQGALERISNAVF